MADTIGNRAHAGSEPNASQLSRRRAEIASFETAPERTAPPQDERESLSRITDTAHPEEAAFSQRPSRRVPAGHGPVLDILASADEPSTVRRPSRLIAALIALAVATGAVGCGGNDLVIGSSVPFVPPTGVACLARDAPCTDPAQCCSGLCQAAVCDCVSAGGFCATSNECCSNSCNAAINACN